MKEKLKNFYQFLKPQLSLLLTVALVLGLLPVGEMMTAKAETVDVQGGRKSWEDHVDVAGKSFSFSAVPETFESYQYTDSAGKVQTVTIDRATELGTMTNPIAINDAKDLILFGKMNYADTTGKYFVLTADEYDMLGDQYYMYPLFRIAHNGYYSNMLSLAFSGSLYGNNAVIKNAYITSFISGRNEYASALISISAGIMDNSYDYNYFGYVSDLSLKDSTFNSASLEHSGELVNIINNTAVMGSIVQGSEENVQNCTMNNCVKETIYGKSVITYPDELSIIKLDSTQATLTCNGEDIYLDETRVTTEAETILRFDVDGSYTLVSGSAAVNGYELDLHCGYYNVTIDPNYEGSTPFVYPGLQNGCLPDDILVRERYKFIGWSTSPSSENTDYDINTAPTTVYAVWEEMPDLASSQVSVKFASDSVVYSGSVEYPDITVLCNGETLKEDSDYKVSYLKDNLPVEEMVDAGTYSIVISNDVSKVTKEFTIEPAEVDVGFWGDNISFVKTYDGTTDAAGTMGEFYINNLYDADDVQLVLDKIVYTYENKDVGSGKIITISGISLTGADAANYKLTSIAKITNGVIEPKEVTITPKPGLKKKAGEGDPDFAFTAAGVIEGEALKGMISREEGEEPGEYAYDLGTLEEENPNYTPILTEGIVFTIEALPEPETEPTTEPTIKLPKKGDLVRSQGSNGVYKVTKASVKNGTVTFIRPSNKKATSITIPKTIVTKDGVKYKVTAIAGNAFKNNSKIRKVTIGSSVTKIGSYAFYNCKNLKNVIIGKNVTTIGKKAFYKCKNLKTITIKTSKLTKKKVGRSAFKNINAKATIKVPKKKLKTYKTILKAAGVGSKVKIKK